MTLKEICELKARKEIKEYWTDINRRYGNPKPSGDSLRKDWMKLSEEWLNHLPEEESPIAKEGQEEYTPPYDDNGDHYIVYGKNNNVTITKENLRKLKNLYCLQKTTINTLCWQMEMPRRDFFLVKTAFGITKDDVPYLDEDLETKTTEELANETLMEKKRLYFISLQEKEIDDMKKELSKYRQKDYFIQFIDDRIKEHFDNWTPPTVNIVIANNGKMLEVPIYDLHFGKLAWSPETGENYDYKIASDRFNYVIDDIVSRMNGKKFERILFPIGQDYFNYDTIDGKTTLGTSQDNDLRWQKLYDKGIELLVNAIYKLSALGGVETFYCSGNHDEMTSYYATQYISAWFWQDKNVSVDTSPNPRKYIEFGKNLIGFTHTDKEKKRIFGDMQVECPEAWGRTLYREWHGGHLHSEQTKENSGVVVRNLSSITAKDAWHHKHGYSGAIARVQSFVYDKENGPEEILITNVRR